MDGGSTTSSITVNAVASDTGGTELNSSSYQYSKDNGVTWTVATSATSYTFNAITTGTYQCKVKVADNIGNSATSSAVAISTQGLGTITMIPSTTDWINGNVTVTITYPPEVVIKQYSTNGTTWNMYTAPVIISTNNTTVYAKGLDDGLNQTTQATLTISNIDKTAPTVTASNGGTTTSSVTVNATASDVDGSGVNSESYQYSKDNGVTWGAATSETSYTFTTLSTGTYQCKVRVADNVGNSATSSVVAISTQALSEVTISATPTEWTNGDVTVTITYPSEVVTKQYSLDGTTWNIYTVPVVVSTNNTTVYAKGLDDGLNQTTQATLTVVKIDCSAPTVAYGTNGGTTPVQGSTIVTVDDVGGSGINASTLQYIWDTQNITTPSSGWTPFSSGATLTKTADALYYLWVKVNDNVGNSVVAKSNVFIIGDIATPVTTARSINAKYSGGTSFFEYSDPVIPAGFVAINTPDASWYNLGTDWNKGLAIQDALGNQFVWVPIVGTTVPYAKWCTTGIAYNSTSLSDNTLPSGFSVSNITTKYKGFYIARYEAMFDYNAGSIRPGSKKSTNKTTVDWSSMRDSAHTGYLWNFINYTDAKTYSENMGTRYGYDATKVGTNLVTGAEWDTTMKWIQNSGVNVVSSSGWGNTSGTIQISGYSSLWKVKNIYDLAGNLGEFDNELYNDPTYSFIYRSAASRTNDRLRGLNSIGFRVALYIY